MNFHPRGHGMPPHFPGGTRRRDQMPPHPQEPQDRRDFMQGQMQQRDEWDPKILAMGVIGMAREGDNPLSHEIRRRGMHSKDAWHFVSDVLCNMDLVRREVRKSFEDMICTVGSTEDLDRALGLESRVRLSGHSGHGISDESMRRWLLNRRLLKRGIWTWMIGSEGTL
ncbi:MAG: hypothetical protein Q9181_004455, partial [Wetmoreana brouardii]